MGTISTLTVDLKANAAKFRETLEKSRKTASKFGTQLRSNLNSALGAMAKAMAAAVVGLGVLIKKTAAAGDKLAKTAAAIGITTEALAGLEHAANITGVGAENMGKNLQKMQKNIGDVLVKGTGEAEDALEKLGLKVEDLNKLPADKQLLAISGGMKNVKSRTEQMSIAMGLFGRQGAGMLNMLDLGAEGIEAMQKEAELLGITLSRIDTSKMEVMNDNITRAQGVFAGLANQITTKFAPVISHIANAFVEWAKETNFAGRVAEGVFNFIRRGAMLVADAINGWKVILLGVEVAFKGFAAVVAKTMNVLVNDVFVGFGRAIQDFVLWPIKKILEVLAPFSDKAASALSFVEELSKPQRIEWLDQLENTTFTALQDSITKLKAAALAEVPSIALDAAFAEIERKATEAAARVSENVKANQEEQTGGDDVDKKLSIEEKLSAGLVEIAKKKDSKMKSIAQAGLMAEKIMATKKALISTKVAIGKAMELGFPMAIPGIAMAVAQGAANVAAIQGVAHGGLDNVPNEGTFLLNKGERVLKPSQNKDLTNFLARSGGASVGGSPTPMVENKIEPSVVVVDNEEKMFEALGSDSASEIHLAQIERDASRYRQALGV